MNAGGTKGVLVRDIDTLAVATWHPDSRPFVEEAVRCHQAGAQRAAVVATWTAVCVDMIGKLEHLAGDGVALAESTLAPIRAARSAGGDAAVNAVRTFEGQLVKIARQLELLDDAGGIALERLHQDRHRCAHPALTPTGVFQPSPELARSHLASALDALLTQPPVVGRLAVERFRAFLDDQGVISDDYVIEAFWKAAPLGTRRQAIDLASKVAMGVTDPRPPDGPANRAAAALSAFARADAVTVSDRLQHAGMRLSGRPSADLLAAAGRVGHLPVFWEVIAPAIRTQISALVADEPVERLANQRVLQLVAHETARTALSELETRFTSAPASVRGGVINAHPRAYFAQHAAQLLREAGGWRHAEQLCQNGVLPVARYLTRDQLADVLDAWANNDQCSKAGDMPGYAGILFDETRPLLPGALDLWDDFLVRAADTNFTYFGVRERLATERATRS